MLIPSISVNQYFYHNLDYRKFIWLNQVYLGSLDWYNNSHCQGLDVE